LPGHPENLARVLEPGGESSIIAKTIRQTAYFDAPAHDVFEALITWAKENDLKPVPKLVEVTA